jgi:hypothetical protein
LSYFEISTDKNLAKLFRESCFIGQRLVVGVAKVRAGTVGGAAGAVTVSRARVEKYVSGATTVHTDAIGTVQMSSPSANKVEVGAIVEGIVDYTASKIPNAPAIGIALGRA